MTSKIDSIVWFKPMTPGGGKRENIDTVFAVRSAGETKKYKRNRARVTIYPPLMKLARIIMGDKIIIGVGEDFYLITRSHEGYKLSPTGGQKGNNVSGTIIFSGLSVPATEEYNMQDIELRDDGSILVLRKKASAAVNA